jgi:hypothetical protein
MAEGAPQKGRADIPFRPTRPTPHIAVTWLIASCLVCDFLMVPVMSSLNGPPHAPGMAIGLGLVGCVLAQGCLLAAFLAWGEGPFLRRLATHWLIALGLYLVWLVGFVLSFVRDPGAPNMAASVALGVPLVSIAAQFPLWLARQFWGWRLVRDRETNPLALGEAGTAPQAWSRRPGEGFEIDTEPVGDPVPDRKLAIRDLMLATLVVAVALALARLAPLDGKDKDAGPVWLFAFVVAAVISSITLLPAGAWLMRRQVFRRGLLWSILYASAWIALVWTIAAATWWFAPRFLAPRAIYVGISSFMFTFSATLILTALIARSRGYRLTGGRNRPPHDR